MHRFVRFSLLIFTLYSLIGFNGCGSPKAKDKRSKLNYDNWLVSGQVANPGYEGGEVLALSLDGMRYRSRIDEKQAFAIQLPGNSSYALYFLETPGKDVDVSSREGEVAGVADAPMHTGREAVLNFEESPDVGVRDTLRLPKVVLKNTINLGQIDIKSGHAYPSVNPSLSLDFDNDGINDFADADDQNDGLADLQQQKTTERIEICHFNDRDEGKTVEVALSELYAHMEDGDTLGPCLAKGMNAMVDASEKEVEVAPKNKAPKHDTMPLAKLKPAAAPVADPAPATDEAVVPEDGTGDQDEKADDEKIVDDGDTDKDHHDSDDKTDEEEDSKEGAPANAKPEHKTPSKRSSVNRPHIRYDNT